MKSEKERWQLCFVRGNIIPMPQPEGGIQCSECGSTGVACKETGRDFIGIELAPEYFKTAKERLEQ